MLQARRAPVIQGIFSGLPLTFSFGPDLYVSPPLSEQPRFFDMKFERNCTLPSCLIV